MDKCPFCLRNDLIPQEKIIAKANWAVLVQEYSQAVPGTLQIVPIWHEMTVLRWLLFLWSFFWLSRQIPPRSNFNISINFGKGAGQTLPHPHIWIIPRANEFAGKGLAHYVSLEAKARNLLGIDLTELVERELATTES